MPISAVRAGCELRRVACGHGWVTAPRASLLSCVRYCVWAGAAVVISLRRCTGVGRLCLVGELDESLCDQHLARRSVCAPSRVGEHWRRGSRPWEPAHESPSAPSRRSRRRTSRPSAPAGNDAPVASRTSCDAITTSRPAAPRSVAAVAPPRPYGALLAAGRVGAISTIGVLACRHERVVGHWPGRLLLGGAKPDRTRHRTVGAVGCGAAHQSRHRDRLGRSVRCGCWKWSAPSACSRLVALADEELRDRMRPVAPRIEFARIGETGRAGRRLQTSGSAARWVAGPVARRGPAGRAAPIRDDSRRAAADTSFVVGILGGAGAAAG